MYRTHIAGCCGAHAIADDGKGFDAASSKNVEAAQLSGMYGDIKALDAELDRPVWSKKGDGLLVCILTDGSSLTDKGTRYTGPDLVKHLVATRKAKLLATFQRVHSAGQCFLMGWYEDCHADAFGKPKVEEHPPVDVEKPKRRKLSLAFGRKKRAA